MGTSLFSNARRKAGNSWEQAIRVLFAACRSDPGIETVSVRVNRAIGCSCAIVAAEGLEDGLNRVSPDAVVVCDCAAEAALRDAKIAGRDVPILVIGNERHPAPVARKGVFEVVAQNDISRLPIAIMLAVRERDARRLRVAEDQAAGFPAFEGQLDFVPRESLAGLRTARELQYRIRRETVLASIASRLASMDECESDAAITDALSELGRFCGGDRAYLFRLHEPDLMTNTHEWTAEGVSAEIEGMQNVPVSEFPWVIGRLRAEGEVVIEDVSTLQASSLEREALAAQGIQSLLLVSLRGSPEWEGFVGIDFVRTKRTFTRDEISLVSMVSDLFSSVCARRAASDRLRRSEWRLKQAEHLARVGSWEYDLKSGVTYWSDEIDRIAGKSGNTPRGATSFLELVVPEDRPMVEERWNGLVDRSEPFNLECHIRRPDGEVRIVHAHASRATEPGHEQPTIVGSVQDVTAIRAIEEQLRRQHVFINTLIEEMHEGLVACNVRGELTLINRAARELGCTGVSIGDPSLAGRVLHSDGVTVLRPGELPIARALAGEHLRRVEVSLRTEDGSIRELLVNGGRISSPDGTLLGAFIVFRDITVGKQAQRELEAANRSNQSILDAAAESISAVDHLGNIIMANPIALEVLGLPMDEAAGRFRHALVHHTRRDGTPYPWEECPVYLTLHDGQSRKIAGDLFWRSDGTSFEVDFGVSAMIHDGRIAGAVEVAEDVTEKRMLQRQLELTSRLAGLGKVATRVAHEFNNVLMGIQPSAELVGRSTDRTVHSAAERILRAVARGKRISQDLLQLTQRPPLELAPVPVREWMEEIAADAKAFTGELMDFEISAGGGDLSVLLDRNQAAPILMNLLLNARDAMNGRGSVTLGARGPASRTIYPFGVVDRPETKVHIVVEDNGCGMTADVAARAFEPLFTTKPTSPGLGLTAAQELVMRHGGELFVESTPGVGTSVHVFLPLAMAAAGVLTVDDSAQVAASGAAQKLLLVEDDDAVGSGLVVLLECEGFEIEWVHRGMDAVAAVERLRPDAVILDIGLPDISGLDVYRMLREIRPQPGVVFSTGHGERDVLSEYTGQTEITCLVKPYDLSALLAAITRVTTAAQPSHRSGEPDSDRTIRKN